MKVGSIALVIFGAGWLAADVYLIVGNVILRETRLNGIARLLDRMPSTIANPIFIFLWIAVLLGWSVPLVLGFRRLVQAKGGKQA
jgi:hypothetical protein